MVVTEWKAILSAATENNRNKKKFCLYHHYSEKWTKSRPLIQTVYMFILKNLLFVFC